MTATDMYFITFVVTSTASAQPQLITALTITHTILQ
ncbi:hypothetical protein LPICM02_340067 [Pseudolactococcus piscium]|nr:hypothetical protein LPICM02_340067 [Lactococcus piscium]